MAYAHARRQHRERQTRLAAEHELAIVREQLQQVQQQMDEQRTTTGAQLNLLLQTLPSAVLAETPLHQVVLANQLLCDLLSLPTAPVALLGLSTTELLHRATNPPRDVAAFTDWMQRTADDPQPALPTAFELQDGRIVQLHHLPLRQGDDVVLHLWNLEDVTDQHYAQRRIQQLSDLAQHGPNPILTADVDGQILWANTAAEPVQQALLDAENHESLQFLRHIITEASQQLRPRTAEYPIAGHFYIWTVVPLPEQPGANVYLTDISVRRRAEAELRRSQRLLARINDTLPTLVFLYDIGQRRLLYCNDQVETTLGYTASELQQLPAGQTRRLVHPDDVLSMEQQLERLGQIVDGDLLTLELRMQHQNGSWRWVSIKMTAFNRDDQGRIQQVVGSLEDVTERHLSTEALAHSRRFLARVSDTVPNLIYLYDIQRGYNLYCNRQITTMLGYSETEVERVSISLFDWLILPDDQPILAAHREALIHAVDGRLHTMECRVRHYNGTICWLRVRESVFARDEHGRPQEVIGSAEEITQQKLVEAERQLVRARAAEQSRLVRQVIDSVPHLVYLKDSEGRYVLANEAVARLFERRVEEVIGHSIEDLHPHQEDAARYTSQDRNVLLTGQQLSVEETFVQPNGEVLCFYSIKRRFVQDDGAVLVLGVDSNITELKRVQQALRTAKEAAEENARVKQEFLANMSHEVRTPLNGILGMAGLLAKSPLDATQTHYLSLIQQSADHLLVVINDVLSAAQLGSGKIRLEYIAFDLYALLRDTVESQRLRAAEKNLDLQLELPDPTTPSRVLGDPHRLRQIVLNLLGNAIKFTTSGFVRLSGYWLNDGHVSNTFHLSVQDSGIGIAAHQLTTIFEPFTQASASTAREYGGSGLGLSISRGLVELLGGHLWADSAPGEGSTFHVELPLPSAQHQQSDMDLGTPAPLRHQSLPACRILLAEDNPVNQLLAATLLRNWGAEVDTAANGLQALECFDGRAYDAVLMDIQMPGMDGVTAARQMRAHPDSSRARTPIIALTAHALPGEAARARQAGFTGYVSKPFQEEKLLSALQQVLSPTDAPEDAPAPAAAPEPVAAPATPTPPAAPAPPLLDLAPLRRLADNDPGFLRKMAELFVRSTPPVLANMRQHLASQNWPGVAADAHFLKSTVSGVGLQQLLPSLKQLEAAGQPDAPSPDAARLAPLVEQVCSVFEQAAEQMQREYLSN